MDQDPSNMYTWLSVPSLYPQRSRWLRRIDSVLEIVGMAAVVIGHGLRRTGIPPWEFGLLVMFSMFGIAVVTGLRFQWSLARVSFAKRHLPTVLAALGWLGGMVLVTIIGPALPDTNGPLTGGPRFWGYVHLSELILSLYAIFGLVRGLRTAAAGRVNPAFLFVCSFLVLISVGTISLMLPICRNVPHNEPLQGAPFFTALFTATSASCVTGLIIEDTGTYWSRTGQTVILMLFQVGGLGIMTVGAFFAAIAGRGIRLTEFANVKELLASDGLNDIRKLIFAILGFTFASELIGVFCLYPLWPDKDFSERVFFATFHSVSAFCNAGFAITENSFVGMGSHVSVWGGVCGLIIVGGIGFATLYNVSQWIYIRAKRILFRSMFAEPKSKCRMTLTAQLVLWTTVLLLIGGTIAVYLLERTMERTETASPIAIYDAWFQAVTFRTAGFNTVDLGRLQPATKLIAIMLMIIGASPGSTGGGVKTVVFAIAAVGLLSVIRGRERVEAAGRTISAITVNRALAIFFVTMLTVMTATILIVIFEKRPELFLDHLFEATSAVGTVGVSSTVTDLDGNYVSTTFSLSLPSRCVIILAMLLGRVGPLTLLLALAGESAPARYEYPSERVVLG